VTRIGSVVRHSCDCEKLQSIETVTVIAITTARVLDSS
jgi:hypothetical protein